MSSTTTHFTKSFPKQADITGSPEQAFHMLDNRDKYYKYLLGGISAGTIAALGTFAPGGSFQYLYAPQIYRDLGREPIGIIGTSSNMIGKFSCVYITLGDFKCFPFVEALASMSKLLKHTDITPLSLEHLKFTKDWKSFIDPIRGTFLPNFFIVYFGQEIPQGSISSDNVKTAMAKMGPGYALWASTVSDAIDNINYINCVIDAFSEVDNLSFSNFYKKHFYVLYDKDTSFLFWELLMGRLLRSHPTPIQRKLRQSRRFSSWCITRYPRLQQLHQPLSFSFRGMSRKKLWPRMILTS
jgi:hypothetical protein